MDKDPVPFCQIIRRSLHILLALSEAINAQLKNLFGAFRRPGSLSPDFSMYRNMPAIMQYWSCFMGRAIAHRYQADGGVVVPNVRLSDKRSYQFCLDGLPVNSTIAIGTHGCIKHKEDRRHITSAVSETVRRLSPSRIIVYGSAPDDVFITAIERGIEIIEFKSLFSLTHVRRDGNGNR